MQSPVDKRRTYNISASGGRASLVSDAVDHSHVARGKKQLE